MKNLRIRERIEEFSFSKFVRKSFIFVAYPGGRNLLTNLKENWKSGIIVGLVYVPLALSLALASGATPNQGIQSAFFGGLASSLFQGSNFNIEGPTGALTTVLSQVWIEKEKIWKKEMNGKIITFFIILTKTKKR